MYRVIQDKQEVYIVQSTGGIGDDLAALPAINFILNNHPHVYLTLWCKSYFKTIARKTFGNHKRLTIRTFDEKDKAKKNIPVKKFDSMPYTNLASHMTEHAFDIICNTRPDDPNDYNYLPISTKGIYLKRFNLPEKYVVVPTGYTAKVRQFLPEIVNEISDYLNKKGYTPVFLGKSQTAENSDKTKIIKGNFDEQIDFSKGIDLIDKTNILETTKIIAEAAAIVGLDNGLLHLAATTDIPIVAGFTTVKPEHRAPYRHGVKGWKFYPVVPEGCKFCQSNMVLTFNFDFRNCYYGDYACCQNLTADLYIEQLEKILT